MKRWKLSPMDLESRARWVEYSRAKDEMFAHTDIKQAPWYVVNADDKQRARLNCIRHLLCLIPYEDLTPETIELPPRQPDDGLRPSADRRPDVRPRGLLRGTEHGTEAWTPKEGRARRPRQQEARPRRLGDVQQGPARRHDLVATGTTGTQLEEALGIEIRKLQSGPLGGDQQLGALIAGGEIDFLVFFWDPLESAASRP